MELPLPSQSYQTRSKPLSSQRLVNLYCEVYKDDDGVLRTKSLLGTPGLVEDIDFELDTKIYGAKFFKNKIVFCIKNKILQYDKNAEIKTITEYLWKDFVQPNVSSNTTYGIMKDSKNSNSTYMITKTANLVDGKYLDEQNLTLDTIPDYFVRSKDIPYWLIWQFPEKIKIKSLNINTRLLPQNFIKGRFYTSEIMNESIGNEFTTEGNDGIHQISITGIPAEGILTDKLYLQISSIEENSNSNCYVSIDNYQGYESSTESNIISFVETRGGVCKFKDKFFVSSVGKYYVSTDELKNWDPKTYTLNESIGFVANDNIMLTASSRESKQYIITTDGEQFNLKTLPDLVATDYQSQQYTLNNYMVNNASYTNGKFILTCYQVASPTNYNFNIYSTDGENWKVCPESKVVRTNKIYNYVYNNVLNKYFAINSSTSKINYQTSYSVYRISDITISNNSEKSYSNGTEAISNIMITSTGRLIICTQTGIKYSDDGLENVYTSNLNLQSNFCIEQNQTLFTGTSNGIYQSKDNGSTWEKINDIPNCYYYGIISDNQINIFSDYYLTKLNYVNKNIKELYNKLEGLSIKGELSNGEKTTYTKQYELLGNVELLDSYIDIADDGDNLFILDDNGNGYYVNQENGNLKFNQVQNNTEKGYEYKPLKSICYLAGRFIGVDKNEGTIRWTEVLNPNGWNALNYIQSETSIDELTAIRSNTREAWVFSPKNIEVYAPTGNSQSTLAFSRVSGAYLDKGCKYKNCICINQNQFYWLATDNCVYRSNGYQAQKISTIALENEILNYGEQSDVLGQIYTQAGHTFYILKFKDAQKTWCFDITTGLWHERESNDGEWRGDLIFSAYNKTYVSDKDSSILYNLDLDVGTDNGDIIKREFVFPTIKNEELTTFHRRLELDMDTGFSNGDNLFLQWSDDGGYNWSNEYWVNLGEKAEYNRKLEWRRLGSAITRIYRIKMSTISKVNIIGAYIDMKKGTA